MRIRHVNGIVSAIIVCFFLVHGALGAASGYFSWQSALAGFVWVGVALVCAHVVISVFTSKQQLSDVEHPPSERKKRHLLLKWVTGGLLAAFVVAHIVSVQLFGASVVQAPGVGVFVTLAVIVALTVHICVGAKSLLVDIGMSKQFMLPFRIVVCAVAAMLAIAVLVASL